MSTLPEFFVFLAIVGILVLLAIPTYNKVQEREKMMVACKSCRAVIMGLKEYAAEHSGAYPQGATANTAFRQLFTTHKLANEALFTVEASPYHGDNKIGSTPDFAEALQPGENHWAMTKGLTDTSAGNTPVVFENPAVKTWPPQWDTRIVGRAEPGRVWKGNKIVVGLNDGSVSVEKLQKGGPMATLAPVKDGKNLFELAGPHEILDVEK